ncbi:DUF1048 domain-containing protein [Leucobacter luti]|uniref:DNA-binding ferritin-like protein (Dps family) n=1 Tax=Leucobacter luti TaxID=340320 RepID=A0A4R6S5S5_9MICO|nr:DUF1048 domain-containing protein [Leucobacter luti]MCW2287442.1 DNA-binding ferritin-like protein (Dps family) [Leucobacter luti]QYM76510.1 DUF1048 domain-containing protein [Leucobacter luti]TCK41665.1 DNA-binding ferritin-like protein (Dps family) [Leucobacter luti]TDP94654.1 DNA-binding ferritin-like protein (Dps family) [Leucobacter luti]
MAAQWIEALTGSLSQKKQYKSDMARVEALPEPYRATVKALHRYFNYYAGISDGDTLIRMIGDHVDLWERAAVDGTPVHDILGEDPVEFAESFSRAYMGKEWIDRERARLTRAIETAIAEAGGGDAS